MSREILIQVREGEKRVAILDNGHLDDFVLEVDRYQPTLGNIYKGRVESVLPSINGAFINIGQEKNGFLYLTDTVNPQAEEESAPRKFLNRLFNRKEESKHQTHQKESASEQPKLEQPKEDAQASSPDQPAPAQSQQPGQSESRSHSHRRHQRHNRHHHKEREAAPPPLQKGQEILVQVVKEPFGTKGARLTAHITLAGRFVVYMPYDQHLGVSRKIDNHEERVRLKEILKDLDFAKMGGFIVRTASHKQDKNDLVRDGKYLVKIWEQIMKLTQKKHAPALIYQEVEFIWKIARDYLTENVDKLIIDSQEDHIRLRKIVDNLIGKEMVEKIHLYKGHTPLFESKNIAKEMEKIYDKKVYLKSGAYIVIEPTEGVTVVDVNSGKFKTRATPEEAAFMVNLEAATEIARQLRLRDVGGIIVIDFIDMMQEDHKRKVLDALQRGLSRDFAKTEVNRISSLGLVEMTRARAGKTIESISFSDCPYCEGRGRVRID